jgi:threonyl-tRNA synthetase
VKTKSPQFLQERIKIWDEFYARQVEAMKNLPREKINITLKDGKVVEGVSFETTPLEVAKKNLKKSLVPDFVVAKVD